MNAQLAIFVPQTHNTMIQKFFCLVGLHKWKSQGSNIADQELRTITLVWFECKCCGESRLKCILSNWK